jgi:GT2 family glycosyltransferase
MDISAVVLSFNSKRYIETCIRSLVQSYAECGLEGEILVVENGSVDGSVAILGSLQAEIGERLKVIYLPENTGTTRSRNMALRIAGGRAVLILDSDAYMNSAALRSMLAYQRANPRAGLVAPRLIYPSGKYQLSVDVFPTVSRKLQRYFSLREIERSEPPAAAGAVDYAISACWLLSGEAIHATGLLDERIFYSPEDVDYCIRLWKAGYQVHYFPLVSVVHDAQEISRPKGIGINRFTIRHAKGLLYLFIKHRYGLSVGGLYRRVGRNS